MWIVKKCETGHRQCVSVRQSVRQSLHPIRYIFHAVSQATGSLSLPLPHSPLLCESLHLAWLLASFSNAACRQQRTKYQVEFSFSASSSSWFTFVPWQQQQQLEYYYNNSNSNNNCGNNSWQSIIARVSFRLSSKFLAFFLFFDNAATGLNKSVSLSPDVIKY